VELDGCSTGCQVDGVEEAEVNDTPAQANGPWSPGVLVRGRIRPRTDVDHLATTLTSTSDVVWETFDGRGPGHCTATDTLLQVLAPDGVQVLGEDDDGGLKACSRVVLRHLPPGRYVARVSAPQPQVMVPSYTLLARTLAVCGNGTVEGVEECDGTPGCDASCDRVPRCGDRWVDAPETCDDGDDQPGDGCDGSCRWEAQPEVEPNDTPPLASGPFLLPALLAGAVTPAGDVDLFSITLATVSDLHVRTTGVAGSCDDMDTVVTLLGPDGVSVLVRRDQGGEGNCAVIDPGRPSGAGARHLAPGTYLLRVEEFLGDHQVPGYLLLVTTPAACGNGVVEGGERCDGTPGCTSTCDRDPLCGDGWVDPPETCDDGNTVGGDRCGATCAWEYVVEEEPNDDPARATGPRPAPVLFRGDIPVGPDVDWYAATLAAFSDLTLETFDGLGPGSCVDLDTVVTLLGPDGSTVLGRADDGGIQTCSRLHVTRLPPGTYRIRVEDFGNDTALGPYALEVLVVATCGNGVVEGSEQCDATAGCSQACARIPTCGDRHVDVPETCDDGNTLSQDGCDAACTMELTPEVEPNDDLPGARSQGLFLSRDTRVSGSLGSAGDRDWFLLGGPVEVVLHAETVGPDGVTCPFDSTLRLLDENATTTLYEDDNHGIHTCSALTVVLPPGMYVLEVAARTVVPAYVLEVVFHGGGTLEQEPNDTPLEMQVVAETRVLRGSHGDNLDVDLFAVPVPEGGSLRLEVVEGDAERCEDGEVDSLVTLYDPTGETLGWDDDGGRGFCSLVDGTGWPPAHPFAHGLPGGLYVVGVEAAPFAQGDGDSGGQFDYRLVITVR
jgi:cysteine-rich repeat protein